MTVKIGINGFGRIGRLAFRRIFELQARGGQVVDYRPGSLTFADAMDMPSDDEAYRKVLGR